MSANFQLPPADREAIENKYHKLSEPYNSLARFDYHGWECDNGTGMDDAEIKAGFDALAPAIADKPRNIQKALFEKFLFENGRLDVSRHDYFPCLYNWGRVIYHAVEKWRDVTGICPPDVAEWREKAFARGEMMQWLDYDHSVPDWDMLFEKGYAGILADIRARLAAETDGGKRDFYEAESIAFEAALAWIARARDFALRQTHAKAAVTAESLGNLAAGAPKTTLDALMLVYLHFLFSECVDCVQVRAIGSGLDHQLLPYYRRDIESGKFTKQQLGTFIAYFLMQFAAIDNYWGHPMYLGGSNADGTTKVNELSLLFLDIYHELGIYNPKLQVKYNGDNTPPAFVEKVFDMIRTGSNSIVCVCEKNVWASFEKFGGVPFERYFDFDISGCYEYKLRNGEAGTVSTYPDMLYPVLAALYREDPEPATYEAFEAAYAEELQHSFDMLRKSALCYSANIAEANPALFYSGTKKLALDKGADANAIAAPDAAFGGAINAFGSAVDALMAVRKIVFEDRKATLRELRDILRDDWEGHGELRRFALSKCRKFGVNDPEADACARRLMDFIERDEDNPAGRAKYELHSARQFIEHGARMAATPDGRRKGEETSKNISPVTGMDTQGATALVLSATAIDQSRMYGGGCIDMMLHPSSARGRRG